MADVPKGRRALSNRFSLALLLGVFTAIALVLFQPGPATGAPPDPVTVPINVTVAEAGAPSFTWTIGGLCSPVPSSGSTGSTVSVSMNSGCSFTIITPADGVSERDRLTNLANAYVTSLSETSCSSPTCSTISVTAHVQELLTIGSGCNTPAVIPVSPTQDRWYNYGTPEQVVCNGVWGRTGGSGTRAASWNWDGGVNTNVATLLSFTSSAQGMSAPHTFNVNTVTQYLLTLDSGATRAVSSITSPTITSDYYWYDSGTVVTYNGNGVFGRVTGAGNRSTSWFLDSGSPTNLNTFNTFTVTATLSSIHTIHVTVKTQYQVSLSASASSLLSTITPPTIAGDNNYWYDSGTLVTVALNGAGPRSSGIGSRLSSYSLDGGTGVPVASLGTVTILNGLAISSAQSVSATVVTQYQLTLDAGASAALSSITPPPIAGDKYWYDSGTQVAYVGNGVYSRSAGTGDRVASWWWDSNTPTPVHTTSTFPASTSMGAPYALHTTTMAQFEVLLTGTYGVSSATPPTIAGDSYWYDSGTTVSLSLQGVFGRASGMGERMTSYTVNNGMNVGVRTGGPVSVLSSLTLTSPVTVTVQTVTQYQLALDKNTVEATSSVTPPTLSGDYYWYDLGTRVTLNLNGVWARNATTGFRLASYSIEGGLPVEVLTSGNLSISFGQLVYPRNVTSTIVTQYLLGVAGGSGVTYSVSPPISKDIGWYDSGTMLNVSTRAIFGSNGTVRLRVSSWSIDGGPTNVAGGTNTVTTSSIVMNSPHRVAFGSVTQYLVGIVLKDSTGSETLSPGSVLMAVNGGTQKTIQGNIWVDAGSTIQIATVNWEGVDVTPTKVTGYTVASPISITVNVRVFEAKVSVKDPLGFSVGGAPYAITFANKTTIHGTTSGDGIISLGVIPSGTFQGTVSYLGTTSTFSGDASSRPTTDVLVPLDYPVIATVGVIIAIAVVAVAFLRRRRSRIQQSEV